MVFAHRKTTRIATLGGIATLLLIRAGSAGVLPDDRADLFYSKYSGGGMDITGTSVLVRKKITEDFAVEANYFIDQVSGASVDVISNASTINVALIGIYIYAVIVGLPLDNGHGADETVGLSIGAGEPIDFKGGIDLIAEIAAVALAGALGWRRPQRRGETTE